MKSKITVKQIIALLVASLLPAAPIALGIIILMGGAIFNFSLAITHFLLPFSVIVGLFFVITSRWSIWGKSFVSIILILLALYVFIHLMMFGYFELLISDTGEEAEVSYLSDETVLIKMPSLDEIGEPENLEYHDYYSQMSIFTCDSDVLIAAYDEASYKQQKNILEEKYRFVSTPLTACGHSCDPICHMDGYVFRVVELEEQYYYPKHVMMIATNDSTQEIVYLCFYDDDLDYIESLKEFLKKNCGWEHIR